LDFTQSKHLRIDAYAYDYLPPHIPQAHHVRQLLAGQAWNVFEIDVGIVPDSLLPGGATQRLPLLFSPLPVHDIFGSHAWNPHFFDRRKSASIGG
jgi:hypothetical protein